MADIAHSLVRRAVDVSQHHLNSGASADGDQDHPFTKISFIGLAVLWATIILYMAVVSAVSYTYGDVVATLAMIESPTSSAIITEGPHDDSKDSPLSKDADVLLVKNAPITGKLRTAVRHLRSIGGPLARFRGLHISILYHVLYSLINGILGSILTPYMRPLVSIFAVVCLCRLHVAWTHAVISMPSSKSWYQRIPSIKDGKKLLLPAATWAAAQQLCLYVPGALLVSIHDTFKHPEVYGPNSETIRKIALLEMFGVFMIFVSTMILIVVPAEVSMKRIEASLLPEEEDTVVPFDRSFSGKFKPTSLGGTGSISILDAWKTFGKEARIRLLKLYAKVISIQVAVVILFSMILVTELRMIIGGDFDRLVEAAKKSFKGEL